MSKKKLNIAIFHFGFFYSGGGERLVLEEAIGLKKLGHEVTLFAPIVDAQKCFPELISKVKVKKILPKILPSWFPDNTLISILAACLFTPLFFYKFRAFDVYFGANQPGPWISFILSKINKKAYVIYLAQPTRLVHPRLIDQKVGLKLVDGFTLLGLFSLLSRPFIRYLDGISIRGAKKVFANGSYMTGVLKEVYGVKPINCPAGAGAVGLTGNSGTPGMDSRFKGGISIVAHKIKKPFALITNRHFPQKKFEYAIEALSLLKKKIPLVITGAPTEYTDFLKHKYRNKNIVFANLLNEEALDYVYKNSAVYLYPAPEEDFGMGIVEAMAHGTPVVAWGNAGPTGIIEHGVNGLLAKPFSIEDFATQIERLLTNKKLYNKISKSGFEKVCREFTSARHANILNKHIIPQVFKTNKNSLYSKIKLSLFKKNKAMNLQFKKI